MSVISIPWARIMAPVAGASGDRAVIEAAAALAAPFGAEVAAVYTPADVADLMPWMGDGFMGGVQVAAVESLKDAAAEGRKAAEAGFAASAYARKTFIALESPVWSSLSMHSRLSDLVVFDDAAARGRGPLAQAFQQMIARRAAAGGGGAAGSRSERGHGGGLGRRQGSQPRHAHGPALAAAGQRGPHRRLLRRLAAGIRHRGAAPVPEGAGRGCASDPGRRRGARSAPNCSRRPAA
ncbi:MAG: universal stress protein [Caulobacteraceae bacterium]